MTPEQIWKKYRPGWLTDPSISPAVNVYHVGDVDRQAVLAIAAAVAETKEVCVQALIGEMYRVDADEIAEFGPSLPANQVIKTCIATIRAQP